MLLGSIGSDKLVPLLKDLEKQSQSTVAHSITKCRNCLKHPGLVFCRRSKRKVISQLEDIHICQLSFSRGKQEVRHLY